MREYRAKLREGDLPERQERWRTFEHHCTCGKVMTLIGDAEKECRNNDCPTYRKSDHRPTRVMTQAAT